MRRATTPLRMVESTRLLLTLQRGCLPTYEVLSHPDKDSLPPREVPSHQKRTASPPRGVPDLPTKDSLPPMEVPALQQPKAHPTWVASSHPTKVNPPSRLEPSLHHPPHLKKDLQQDGPHSTNKGPCPPQKGPHTTHNNFTARERAPSPPKTPTMDETPRNLSHSPPEKKCHKTHIEPNPRLPPLQYSITPNMPHQKPTALIGFKPPWPHAQVRRWA